MAKHFQIGDRVRIKKNLTDYYTGILDEEASIYAGKLATILGVSYGIIRDCYKYTLKIDGISQCYNWMGEWLEEVEGEDMLKNVTFNGKSIKRVIFNNPATIIIWNDGTKTVTKCHSEDVYNKEHGLAMALVKSVYGTNYYRDVFEPFIAELNDSTIKQKPFEAGDKVKVKSWEKLIKEFGEPDDAGNIDVNQKTWFLKEMRSFCGKEYTIAKIYDSSGYTDVEFVEYGGELWDYHFTIEMIEHI